MAKRPTINTLANTASPTYLTQLNQNFTNIRDQFDNTLSLDGSTPNAMNADLDLNGNDLLNAGSVNTATLRIGGQMVSPSETVVVDSVAVKKEFDTVALLLADTGTYTNYAAGDYFRVADGGFTYRVALSGATDHHVVNAGGVKLYVLPGASGYNVKAFGAKGDNAVNDTAALQKAIDVAQAADGGLFVPTGIYQHTGLTVLPSKSLNCIGEAYDNTAGDSVGGAVLLNTNTTGGHSITIDNTPFTGNFDKQIRFSNITIRGNALSGDGFNVDQCMVFLENVWISNHGGNGYFALRCYSSAFRQVSFSNNLGCGFRANRALNAVHFDHCLFNGNAGAADLAGCLLSGAGGIDRHFGVTFTACDFTGNGTFVGAGNAFGLAALHTAGVSLTGCYFENNKTHNLYADSTTSNMGVRECYFQDALTELLQVDGLIFENNVFLDVGGLTTALTIDGGIGTGRYPHRIFGTQFSGTVTKILTGGATEAQHFLFGSAPTAGTWKLGDVVWNTNFQQGGQTPGWICATAGTPGTWIPIGQVPFVFANHGDANATLTTFSSFTTNFWRSPLTNNRTVTLSTTNAFSGAQFRVVRATGATGAFDLDVGGLKTLAAGQWCDVTYDGSVWLLSAFGSL